MDNIWGTFKTTKSHLFATYVTSTIASIFYHVALMNILIISAKIDIMKKSMQLSPHYYRNHRHATSHIHTGTNQFPPLHGQYTTLMAISMHMLPSQMQISNTTLPQHHVH